MARLLAGVQLQWQLCYCCIIDLNSCRWETSKAVLVLQASAASMHPVLISYRRCKPFSRATERD